MSERETLERVVRLLREAKELDPEAARILRKKLWDLYDGEPAYDERDGFDASMQVSGRTSRAVIARARRAPRPGGQAAGDLQAASAELHMAIGELQDIARLNRSARRAVSLALGHMLKSADGIEAVLASAGAGASGPGDEREVKRIEDEVHHLYFNRMSPEWQGRPGLARLAALEDRIAALRPPASRVVR